MWRPGQRPAGGDDEPALVRRSQRGDVAAFNCLVESHQQAAYALALRMIGEPEAAADVAQDAFLSAFRAIGSFRGMAFRPWLLRIVSNGCYDFWRARGRHPVASLDALLDPVPEEDTAAGPTPAALIEHEWDPERIALRGELVGAIQAALLRLPDEQRLALILSDVQGLAYEEIAQVMGTSLGTVKSRIARGRGHMRDLLRQQEELLPAPYRRRDREE